MSDAHLKSYIDRILRCREAEDLAKQDTKAVYAELAAEGYEKSVVGQVVTFLRKREKDGDKLSEQSAKFDLYLEAYERPSHAHTRVRADDAPRADGGANIVTKHTEIATNEGGATETNPEAGHGAGNSLLSEPSGPDVNGHPNTPEEANEMDREEMRVDEVGHSLPAEKGREAIPAGPEGVDLTHAEAGESPAPSFLTKPPSPLRPHCQRPEMCAGVGRTHCHTCTKAMREQEEFA